MYLFHSDSPEEINTVRIYKKTIHHFVKSINNPLGGNVVRKTQEQYGMQN